jgi:hypothetical protein
MDPATDIHRKLESLSDRIAAKRAELEAQGVLHGPAREEAIELDMRRDSLRKRLESARAGKGAAPSELAGDVEVLKHLFEHWVARTDRLSEGR